MTSYWQHSEYYETEILLIIIIFKLHQNGVDWRKSTMITESKLDSQQSSPLFFINFFSLLLKNNSNFKFKYFLNLFFKFFEILVFI